MQEKSLNHSLMLIMLILVVFSGAQTTQAALEIVEDAIEVTPRQIEWPSYDDGRLIVRSCRDCEAVVLTVNAETTEYFPEGFAGLPQSRQELIRKATSGRNVANSMVYLFYSPEDGQVTRVVLDLGLR